MQRRKMVFAAALLALAGAAGVGTYLYREYRAQQNAYSEYIKALELELSTDNITIKRYLDRFLLGFALTAKNKADETITINRAMAEIFLESRLVEKRELKSLTIFPGSREVLLNDVTLKTELLDAAILEAKIDKQKPEEAKLALTIKIYPIYQFKLARREVAELHIEPIVISDNISLLMLMGGKTQEESAKEFAPLLSS